MAGRRLSPEEQQIWDRLSQSVRPLPGRRPVPAAPMKRREQGISLPDEPSVAVAAALRAAASRPPAGGVAAPAAQMRPNKADSLDKSWEKRISSGALVPEMSVDLHGYTLAAAHQRLDQMLARAVAAKIRVLLVVTGNPRPAPIALHQEKTRGAIRAEIGHWLALSPHSDAIISVRTAHPRHGGRGALYIILRRSR